MTSKLGPAGQGLWAAVTNHFDLEPHHEIALANACQHADMVARLENLVADDDALTVAGSTGQPRVHPAVAELRQQRLALSRLLRELALPAEGTAPPPTPATSRHAREAANARWSRERTARGGA